MKKAMGQIIRELRKERRLTQEELAEQLGVTFQAISKWENGLGMPDISQIVPIANAFGVSTDTLFGMVGSTSKEEVSIVLKNAQAEISFPLTAEKLFKKYSLLQNGLKLYPNNIKLLIECLETGLALSYPENKGIYYAEYAEIIYRECVRYAKLIISYAPKSSDVMRAHMIMVILHSAYGNFSEAVYHAEHFPYRADYNIHVMYAYYAHWQRDYINEARSCQYGVWHYLEGLLNITTRLAKAYMLQEKYKDAVSTLKTSIDLIQCVFKDHEIMPPMHHREQGDLYMLLAEAYLRDGDADRALFYLEKMVNYDLNEYKVIDNNIVTKTPLLNSIPHDLYKKRVDRYQILMTKLTNPAFEDLKDDVRYRKLLQRATE